MKRCTLIAVSAFALSLTSASLGDVIFNNFGPGDSYITSTGWAFYERDGAPFDFDVDQGMGFTVGGGDFFLDSIDMAIGLSSGQNIVFIDVYTTVGGLPGVVIDSAVIGPNGHVRARQSADCCPVRRLDRPAGRPAVLCHRVDQ